MLSNGLELPDSIPVAAESALKAKFDRRWNSAAAKYESKVKTMVDKVTYIIVSHLLTYILL